jgi:cell volume regulation protein A
MAFHDTATWLFQIVMFLVLGLLATPSRLLLYAGPALLVAAALMLVARPAAVALCLAPFRYAWRETLFVAWVGLRGAVGIFLASVPMLAGLHHAELYFDVAFVVVLVSLLVQGWTIVPVARRLGLALPRRSQETRRVELDLPGQLESELVGYPVGADSPVLRRAALPPWARLMMLVRDERIFAPARPDELRPGDYAYVLAPPWRAHLLDRLFATPDEEDEEERGFFGEFVFDGDMKLGRLIELYDLPVPPADRDTTLSEHFARTINEHPVVGDRLRLGPSALVVREVEGDRVARVGLQLEAAPAQLPLAGVRRWLGRLGALSHRR